MRFIGKQIRRNRLRERGLSADCKIGAERAPVQITQNTRDVMRGNHCSPKVSCILTKKKEKKRKGGSFTDVGKCQYILINKGIYVTYTIVTHSLSKSEQYLFYVSINHYLAIKNKAGWPVAG